MKLIFKNIGQTYENIIIKFNKIASFNTILFNLFILYSIYTHTEFVEIYKKFTYNLNMLALSN